MLNPKKSARPIFALAALAVAGTSMLSARPAQGATVIPNEYQIGGFAIGCQAYSFNRFSVFEAIEKTAQAGGRVIEFYPGQKLSAEQPDLKLDQNASDEVIAKVKEKLAKHHIMAVNFGVVGMNNNEAELRKLFEFARKMGIPALTTEPDVAALDLIEKMVKEFDIKVGIHDHPRRPDNPNYRFWDPNYVLSIVKDRDARMGACADTGHWVRSGIKPIDALRILQGRIISSHLKDLNVFEPGGHDVPFGQGVSDIPAILDELKRQNFAGNLSIEYEYNWDQSVPEIAQCIGFVRGYVAPRNATK